MNDSCVEIKSALWQKIFITLLILPFAAFGAVALFQMWPPHIDEFLMEVCWFAGCFAIWWPVMRYSIRADKNGISQTNGFFHQSIRWSDVAAYYVEPNRRYYRQHQQHVEPVMLDAKGKIIFQGFAHILVTSQKDIERRREFWQFVKEQLQDKPRKEPPPDLDKLARESMEINWAGKSLHWKIGRIFTLGIYILFWLCLGMGPIYYLVTNGISVPIYVGNLLAFITFGGPALHAVILIKIRKRKIAEGLRKNQRY